jgi:hypothetical protein
MRFLFGDSTPFPLGYNFLTTLEAFMAAATRIVQLEHESTQAVKHTEDVGQHRVKGLEALEQFHTVVMRAVQDTAQKVQHALALEYARHVADLASRYVDDYRRSTLQANERESAQIRGESERRAREQRGHLETFLKVARMPVLKTKITMRLQGDSKGAAHAFNAAFENPDGIATAFTLNAGKVAAWLQPRRVGEFIQGMELMVGVDKSWLRGTVTTKQMSVDDWIVTQFDAADDIFDVVLRRRMAEKETLHFHVRRTEAGFVGKVEHGGVPGGEQLPANVGPQDLAQLERLWIALRTATRDVLEHKEQLISVSLDGAPVFEAGLAVAFVVRLVAMFAPTVREIAKRSSNEFELSLKMETDGGRREEVYLRKETLVSNLQPLPAAGREVFAPLGLDTWVPGLTSAPPPVVSGG